MAWAPILTKKKKEWEPILTLPKITEKGASPFSGFSAMDGITQSSTPSRLTGLSPNKQVLTAGKTLAQSLMQGFGATGAALKGLPEQARALATNTPVRPGSQDFTPTGKVQEALYGTKEPINLAKQGEAFGASKAGLSPTLVGGFSGILDLAGGGGVKGLAGLTKALKAADKIAEVVPLLKKAGFADDIISQYAGTFAKLKDSTEIERGLLSAEKLQNSTKAAGFEGFTDLSTKTLEKLKGRSTVSKQFIEDLTNSPDLKQAERDAIRNALAGETSTINVKDFANKVKSELLPLKVNQQYIDKPRWEGIVLPDELRGPVSNYSEHVYESPVPTSAGAKHDFDTNKYFGHTRIEDLPESKAFGTYDPAKAPAKQGMTEYGQIIGKDNAMYKIPKQGGTRRVIEIQGDLTQMNNIKKELPQMGDKVQYQGRTWSVVGGDSSKLDYYLENPTMGELTVNARDLPIGKLLSYSKDNAAHMRMIREEVKQAAKDGKTKLQFPTGETAMKIEGLGSGEVRWSFDNRGPATPGELKVGREIFEADPQMGITNEDGWIITDVLGDGKFKAVPKKMMVNDVKADVQKTLPNHTIGTTVIDGKDWHYPTTHIEEFDISGKVDTNNPIYKFYEKEVGKYLTNKYGAKRVTDAQGVTWFEVQIDKAMAKTPVEAYGVTAGIEPEYDENGKLKGVGFDPTKAALGIGAAAFAKRIGKPQIAKATPESKSLVRTEKALSVREAAQLSSSLKEGINLDRLAISKSGKDIIAQTVEEIKPQLEKQMGMPLSNKEVIKQTEASAKIFQNAVGRETTKQWETALLNTRQKLASLAETGVADREFIETLKTVKSLATDAGRKLQSFSIEAKPADITMKQYIMEAVLKVEDDLDKVIQAAEGVDFNNFSEAAQFYRKFVKPNAQEWIDLLRYNSMLSSPLTHIVNTASNLVNSSTIAPLEKLVTGAIDFLALPVRGERTAFMGEAPAFLKGYFSNVGEGARRFGESMKGTTPVSNLDTRHIPLTKPGGVPRAIENTLSVPLRFLEASDQFFTALTEAGEKAALEYRKEKGITVRDIAKKAKDKAAYRLYREELFPEGQGTILDAVDHVTNALQQLRTSKNPVIANIFKFTVPFLRTPTNIFKQGLEYSPAGFITLIGATDKQTQLAKAAIGSAVFAGAATLLGAGRLTWSEPIPEKEKNAFKSAGMQPYSVKIGDEWVSYQKLPPPVAFPLAMVAMLDSAQKEKKLDEGTTDLILSAIAKYGDFLGDQSYAKSIGDLLSAVRGGESSVAQLISNYPQQLVPFRALGGWLSRLIDHVQRKPDPDGTFVEKQVQLMMMSIPGLSQNVPARTNSRGEEIAAQNPVLNAFLPVRTSKENPEKASQYQDILDIKKLESDSKVEKSLLADTAEHTAAMLSVLSPEELATQLKDLSKANPALAEKVLDILEADTIDLNDQESTLKSATIKTRATFIVKALKKLKTPEEKKAYLLDLAKKKILTDSVLDQMETLND